MSGNQPKKKETMAMHIAVVVKAVPIAEGMKDNAADRYLYDLKLIRIP